MTVTVTEERKDRTHDSTADAHREQMSILWSGTVLGKDPRQGGQNAISTKNHRCNLYEFRVDRLNGNQGDKQKTRRKKTKQNNKMKKTSAPLCVLVGGLLTLVIFLLYFSRALPAFATGEALAARPSKIVAGHDPEKTNLLLQAMARAVHDKVDHTDAVRRVLAGEKVKGGPSSSSSATVPASSKQRPTEGSSKTADRKHGSSSAMRESSSGKARETRPRESSSGSKSREERHAAAAPPAEPTKAPIAAAPVVYERPTTAHGRSRTRAAAPEAAQPAAASEVEEDISARRRDDQQTTDEFDHQSGHNDTYLVGADQSKSLAPPEADLPSNTERTVRRRERPTTARTAAARQRPGSGVGTADESASQPVAPQVHIIRHDDPEANNDDDDMFVVVAAELHTSAHDAAVDAEEHGALMRKIQEKKASEEADEGALMMDSNRLRAREQTEREVEKLRTAIQTLCRSANPLGKIVDYIQEDVDGMHKEYERWHAESLEHKTILSEELMCVSYLET